MRRRHGVIWMFLVAAMGTWACDEGSDVDLTEKAAVPLTFKAVNATDHTRFMEPEMRFYFFENGEWSRVYLGIEESECFPLCSELENGACANCELAKEPMMKLEPGKSSDFEWDGLEDVKDSFNSCACHHQREPRAGTYKITVCSSSECEHSSCGTLAQPIHCVEKTFELPSSEEAIVIELTAEDTE